jgi:hypothetical protein
MGENKPPTANEITAELLIQIPRINRDILCWRQNSGKGIGWNQVRAITACLKRGDIPGALKFLTRPMSFGLVGAPDIMMIVGPHGRVGGCEIKADGDEQRETQEAWQARVCGLGGFYVLAEHVGWSGKKPDIAPVIAALREAIHA